MDDEALNETIDFENLVRASDALEWLTPHFGSRTLAKQELADSLRDGRMRSFALRAWDSTERALIEAWALEPDAEDEDTELEENLEVRGWVWRHSRQWQMDQSDWRWPSGRFTSVVSVAPFKRILVEHVHFDRDEIVDLAARLSVVPAFDPPPPYAGELKITKSDDINKLPGQSETIPLRQKDLRDLSWSDSSDVKGSGRPLNGAAWAAIIMKVHELKSGNKFDQPNYVFQKALVIDLVAAADAHGKLGETKIKPVVSALYKANFVTRGCVEEEK